MTRARNIRSLVAAQDGLSLLVALGVMFVTSLLMAAAFKAANGDIHLTQRDSAQKDAYYAALAGVQEYEYHLQANPDYWETCEAPAKEVQETKETEHYEIKLLTASTSKATECSKSNPYGTMIQSTGAEANTFRIKSIGTAGKAGTTGYETSEVVATYRVVGFLNYAYFTQYEDEDPNFYEGQQYCENYRSVRLAEEEAWNKTHAKEIEEFERKYRESPESECREINFASLDSVAGPMHTDDTAQVCGGVTFGRKEHNPADVVEIDREYVQGECSEAAKPTFNTSNGSYLNSKNGATELLPPESDKSLETYAKEGGEGGDIFEGETHIVLHGKETKMTVTTIKAGKESTETMAWPKNGLVYVRADAETPETPSPEPCNYTYTPFNSDNSYEAEHEKGCGTVYVEGTYSESLTIGAEDDVIIHGNIYPTSVEGNLGAEPTGTDTLGLIGENAVRVYHPLVGTNEGETKIGNLVQGNNCGTSNASGVLSELWVYGAILSTNGSFIVDNYNCGAHLKDLNIYGAIAQRFRGPVGLLGGQGYTKDYKYDERLAVDEPPYFLNPINAGWEVSRETAATKE